MLRKRIIVCLDVDGGRVVKGVRFVDLRVVGDPVALAQRYEAEGADEIVFLDISASVEGRRTLLESVRRTAERLFIPLTVGGGITAVDDVAEVLRAGADKVSLNTAVVHTPALLTVAANRFGAQCIVASIDARREVSGNGAGHQTFAVYTHGGRNATGLDAVEWAGRCATLGAGEIMITSIDADGGRNGYDLPLTRAIVDAAPVPVIASGGAGSAAHMRDAFLIGRADAALAAGIFHEGLVTVDNVKRELVRAGVPVRLGTTGTNTNP
jgi:cyclase